MSYVKSSLFYLKDINDFLKTKFVRYGDMNSYLQALSTDEHEVIPYLERVIMNRHKYELNKQMYINESASKQRGAKVARGVIIALDIIFCLIVIGYCTNAVLKGTDVVSNTKTCLMGAIAVTALNCLATSWIQSTINTGNDYEGRTKVEIPAESQFDDFSSSNGVAMYYALKHSFNEPATSTSRREIKALYDMYVSKITTKSGSTVTNYPQVSELMKTADWAKLVSSAKHGVLTKFASPDGKVNYHDHIESLLSYADNTIMLKELLDQARSLRVLVDKEMGNAETASMSKEAAEKVIMDQVIPVLNVKSALISLAGLKIKQESAMTGIDASGIVQDDAACMFNCELDDRCVVAAFNIPSKKCSKYSNKVAQGNVLTKSEDDLLLVKGDDIKTSFYVEGGGLIAEPTSKIWDIKTANTDMKCTEQCDQNNECIASTVDTDGNCVLKMSATAIALDNIAGCDPNKEVCTMYKQMLSSTGTHMSPADVFVKMTPTMVSELSMVMQKNTNLVLVEHYDFIKTNLTNIYGFATYTAIEGNVVAILETVQSKVAVKPAGVPNTPSKYITKQQFADKFDSMTLSQYQDMVSSVDTIDNVATQLYMSVKRGVAANLSAEQNPFLEQQRTLQQRTILIAHISIVVILLYLLFVTHNLADITKATVKKDLRSKMFLVVPGICIAFVIVLVTSQHKKNNILYQYNRDILEQNGDSLVNSLDELNAGMHDMQKFITSKNKNYAPDTPIKTVGISSVDVDDLYDGLVASVDLLDKCNLLVEGTNIQMPFPWTDITINLIIIAICVAVLFVVFAQINPITIIKNIKNANEDARKIAMNIPVSLDVYKQDDEPVSIILQYIAFVVFLIIVIAYSTTLVKSSNDYKLGLYNSKYYAESRCASC
jgi:hypothetical protein